MDRTDEEIVVASVTEPRLFGVIFERHFVAIHGYASRRLGRSRGDDLAGEVFRIAFGRRATYEPARGGVRPWLYGIAHNVLRDDLRKDERADRAWRRSVAVAAAPDDGDPADRVDAQLAAVPLGVALDRLLPADREAFVLHVVEQLTYAEVAAVMDTPIGTVRSRISRARHQLRSELDVEPEGANLG